MSELTDCSLGELVTFENGDRSSNYPSLEDNDQLGYPFVSASDISESGLNLVDCRRISQRAFDRLRAGKFKEGDILFCLRGTIGKVVRAPAGSHGAIASSLVIIRAPTQSISQYVYYFLSSDLGRRAAMALDNGTAQPNLSVRLLSNLTLQRPPDSELGGIVSVLSALDDKIDLNRRMNKTLEAMARAIFKDWFVDFGPTRAKMAMRGEDPQREGVARAPYLAPDIWSLFPDRLDDEGKPEGWQVRSVYEIADVVYGAPFSSKLFNSEGHGRPLIRIRDLPSETPGIWTPEDHPKGYMVRAGDIVVGMDGEFRAYLWGGDDAWLNQRVCVFKPKVGFSAAFVRNSIYELLAEVEATEIATTVIHLGKNDIDRFAVIMPREKLVEKFNGLCQPLYDRIVANKRQSRTLAATRDFLLPKLMSGEVRVKDGEKLVGEAI